MTTPFGAHGCRCVRVHEGGAVYRWDRDTTCRYHGLLPRDRTDTGVYRVVGDLVDPDSLDNLLRKGLEQAQRGETVDRGDYSQYLDATDPAAPGSPDGPECPPGIHSIFDPCPGGCLNDFTETDKADLADSLAQWRAGDVKPTTTAEEESWWKRLRIRLKAVLLDGIG
ncbi:hypothetical protein [Streptomyces sp. S1]|uniref:hypothetical protein n=1 Tax=Streptomyces sp. S1 TaxID=718288 RepID=UPI003D755728